MEGVKNNAGWSGQLGFLLAAAGSSIGLGNIWRFPYMTGMNGGGAFVVIYLLVVLLIGVPLMMAEIALGRAAGSNPMEAFSRMAAPKSAATAVISALLLAAGIVLLILGNPAGALLLFLLAGLFAAL